MKTRTKEQIQQEIDLLEDEIQPEKVEEMMARFRALKAEKAAATR